MALPTSGSLSGDQIDDEFPDNLFPNDGGRPMRLSEYRGVRASRNGVYYTLPAAPNPIAYSDFRGVSAIYEIDILIIGGGGGGGGGTNIGNDFSGGGGGAGGLRIINDIFAIPEVDYTITVGSGGAGKPGGSSAPDYGERGNNGGNSSFKVGNTTYTATGGGGGGGGRDTSQQTGGSGGSGGGAGGVTADNTAWGNGTAGQGNRGGGGDKTANSEGGGGGGYNEVGATARVFGANGDGGSGYNLANFMGTAAYRTRVAGGGGGGRTTGPEGGGSGTDGGGNGAFRSLGQLGRGDAQNGANLSGGGGGGGCENNGGGGGGSGVVIVRYRGTITLGSGGTVFKGKVGQNEIDYVFHRFGSNSTFTG